MIEAIGIGGIVGESAVLMRRQAKALVLMALVYFVLGLPEVIWPTAPEGDYPTWKWMYLVLSWTFEIGLALVVYNGLLNDLRTGTAAWMPDGFAGKYMWFQWKSFLLILVLCLCAVVIILPLAVGYFAFQTEAALESGQMTGFGLAFYVACIIGFGLPMTRLGFAPMGVISGEDSSLRRSWRMTRKNTLRLFLFTGSLLALTMSGSLFADAYEPGMAHSLKLLAALGVSTLFLPFLTAAYVVWYDRLNAQYESMSELERLAD